MGHKKNTENLSAILKENFISHIFYKKAATSDNIWKQCSRSCVASCCSPDEKTKLTQNFIETTF